MRLADAILDGCLCDVQAPLAGDPARNFGLDKAQAHEALAELRPWLNERQRMLWANRRDALLLVLQGPDCSGKDGVIRRVVSACDPQGIALHAFQVPDACARRHHFLWRYRRALPAPGMLGVFNRSHYEGLVSDPVDGLCTEDELPARTTALLAFEAQWPAQRIHPLKCYLQISPAEQKQRLLERLTRPDKRWKLQASDLQAHREFAAREARWSATLAATHSVESPWYVIPAEHRWLRDWLLASLLARELENLALDWPPVSPPFSRAALDD